MEKNRNKLLVVLLSIAFLFCLLTAGVFGFNQKVKAEEDIKVKIYACNLEFGEDVHILYAVEVTGGDYVPELLVWTEEDGEYLDTDSDCVTIKDNKGSVNIEGHNCLVFNYNKLSAKQMTDNIYTKARINKGDKDNPDYEYSNLNKYSVLQYSKNMKEKYSESQEEEDIKFLNVIDSMLNYGASVQIYKGYKTDRLANATYYEINLIDCKLEDGTNKGLYTSGESITITAEEKEDYEFNGFVSSLGREIENTNPVTLTVQNNENISADYKEKAPKESVGLSYALINNGTEYEVTGMGECEDTELVIPSTYNGKPVTSIGKEAFKNCSSLQSIEIPNSVTSIGDSAFSGCSSLQEITIPFVGNRAGVTSSDTYQYPFGEIFGMSSYTGGTGTQQLYYGYSTSSIISLTYYIPTSLKKVTVLGGYIPYGAFYNCSNIEEIVLGGSVTSIGECAFYNCSSLTSVTIGNSVTSIGYEAFRGCSKLLSIEIPNSVTSIGVRAFYNCSSLTSVTIGNSVTSIGDYAFYNCSDLQSIDISNSVTSIGNYAFRDCSSLQTIEIPNSVTSIGGSAFYNCESLQSVTIGNSVTSIGEGAFYNCSSLQSVYYTGTIDSWCEIEGLGYLMSYGSSTKQLYINNEPVTNANITTTTKINDYVFRGCSLQSVTIGNSVTSIGEWAFCYCSSLTSVTIGNSGTSIGDYAFYGCSSLQSVYYTGTIDSWCEIEGLSNLMSYGSSTKQLYINNEPVTTANITTATKINAYAFYYCSSLTTVTIGNSVTSIGWWAFRGCSSLQSIEISNSVTSIGREAFSGCSSLQSIVIPNSVTSIGYDAFYRCSKLQSVTFKNTEGWYVTENSDYTGGTLIDVTNPTTNATYFKSTYRSYYWYKK